MPARPASRIATISYTSITQSNQLLGMSLYRPASRMWPESKFRRCCKPAGCRVWAVGHRSVNWADIIVRNLELMRTITLIAVMTATAGLALPAMRPAAAVVAMNFYVNPAHGSDAAAGTRAAPVRTIQQAMDRAVPGTVIHLAAGTYSENVVTRTNGRPARRIVIEGPALGTATLYGTGHVMTIRNSYYTLRGFSIDGQQQVEIGHPVRTWPTAISQIARFKASIAPLVNNDRLIYIDSGSAAAGVTGTIIDHMTLTGAGGECIRERNNATDNVVKNSVIRYCGMYTGFARGMFAYHNGEGIYIGTSPRSSDLPGSQNDQSSGNSVEDDTITTYGSECFDVKENAHDNTLSNSLCADNTEPVQDQGSNVELRGYANTVSKNRIAASAGYGLKISSDTTAEDLGHNNITSNTFRGQPAGALYDASSSVSGSMCGNAVGPGSAAGDFPKHPGWSSACQNAGHQAAVTTSAMHGPERPMASGRSGPTFQSRSSD